MGDEQHTDLSIEVTALPLTCNRPTVAVAPQTSVSWVENVRAGHL